MNMPQILSTKSKGPSSAVFNTLVHNHLWFLSSVYSISYSSKSCLLISHSSLQQPLLLPATKHGGHSHHYAEQSSSQEHHAPEVILFTQISFIFHKILNCLYPVWPWGTGIFLRSWLGVRCIRKNQDRSSEGDRVEQTPRGKYKAREDCDMSNEAVYNTQDNFLHLIYNSPGDVPHGKSHQPRSINEPATGWEGCVCSRGEAHE